MKTTSIYAGILLALLLSGNQLFAQQFSSLSTSKSVSGGNADEARWVFGMGTGVTFGLNNNESSSFRGNGAFTKMSGKYYFGNVGLSATTGVMSGTIRKSSLSQFITERGFSQDQVKLTKGNPFNGIFLLGPSFRFGKRILVNADLQGGLFLNDPGNVDIVMKNNNQSVYRFDKGGNNYFPGFSGSFNINYPLGRTTQFFINADYLQSGSSVNLLDLKGGIDVPVRVKRDLKMMTAGIGIVKSFGSNESNRSKRPGRTKYTNILSLERQPGNCGPLTVTATNPDGSLEQMTFSGPEDAAQFYSRLSSGSAETKQVQEMAYAVKDTTKGKGTTSSKGSGWDVSKIGGNNGSNPVKYTRTNVNGSMMQMTFNCADDAAQYIKLVASELNEVVDVATMLNSLEHWGDPHVDTKDMVKGWDGSVKGNSIAKEGNDESDRKGWDGTVKNGSIKVVENNAASDRKGWDGSVKGNSKIDDGNVASKNKVETWGDPHVDTKDMVKGWDGSVKGNSIAKDGNDESERKGWDGTVKNGSTKVVENNAAPERKGWDGTVKGKPNMAEDNSGLERKGWDGSVKGNSITKDASSTSEKKGWDGTVKNGSTKVVENNAASERKGWDGSVKGNSFSSENSNNAISQAQDFNTTRSNRERGQFLANPNTGNNGSVKGNSIVKDSNDESGRKGWDGTVKNGSTKVVENNVASERKGWDGSVKGNSKIDEGNVASKNKVETWGDPHVDTKDMVKGWDGSVKGNSFISGSNGTQLKAVSMKSIMVKADMDGDGVYETDVTGQVTDEIAFDENGKIMEASQKSNTNQKMKSVSNRSSLVMLDDDLYLSYGTATVNGKEVPVKSVLKTKHDTVKNSINNIR